MHQIRSGLSGLHRTALSGRRLCKRYAELFLVGLSNMEVGLVAVNSLVHPRNRCSQRVRRTACAGLRPGIAGLSHTRRAGVRETSVHCGLASLLSLGCAGVHLGGACLGSFRITSSSNRSLRSLGPANAGPLTSRVCRAWHVTMSVKVRQPGFRRAEG